MGGNHAMTAEEVKHHVHTYLKVFGALLFLTVVTVGVSYLHVEIHWAVIIALAVATLKASLVSLYFMHLIDEKKIIYYTLALTAVLCFILMWVSVLPFQQNHVP